MGTLDERQNLEHFGDLVLAERELHDHLAGADVTLAGEISGGGNGPDAGCRVVECQESSDAV